MPTPPKRAPSSVTSYEPKNLTRLLDDSRTPSLLRGSSIFLRAIIGSILVAISSACSHLPADSSEAAAINPADLLIVDCLLPPQTRQLGTHINYLAPRRAIRTPGAQCALRGGEYVAHDRADFRTALSVWLPQAEQGDPEAQTYVGEIYEKGLGNLASYEQAAHWYQRAADQNYSRAQINLGYLYESGLGVKRDLTHALNLYRQASGFTVAQLEYVSSIEIANREASVLRSKQLQEEVYRLQDNINRRNNLLKAQKQELTDKQDKIEALSNALTQQPDTADNNASALAIAKAQHHKERESLQTQLNAVIEKKDSLAEQLRLQHESTAKLQQQQALSEQSLQQLRHDLDTQSRKEKLLSVQLKERNDSTESSIRALEQAKTQVKTLQQQIATLESHRAKQAKEKAALNAAASQAEKTLRHQIAQQKKIAEQFDIKLANQQDYYQKQQAQLESSLASNRDITEQQHQQFEARSAADQVKLQQLQSELDNQRAEYLRQSDALESLQKKLSGKQAALAPKASENIAQTQATGPSINIIDPPVMITRSASTMKFSGSASVNIIGQIDPADNLFAFRINGRDQAVNESGLFQYTTDNTREKKLEFLAIDRQGISTRLAIDVPEISASDAQTEISTSSSSAQQQLPPLPARQTSAPIQVDDIAFGNYHALVIGNDNYESMSDLKTASNDAIAVAQIFREKYGFNTVLLLNASQQTLLTALERMRATLGHDDNLVIYYAGHGELDESGGRGFWLPIDASATNKSRWIANSVITSMIDTMKAKHVLVIADSCYSGTMSQSSVARLLPEASTELKRKWLRAISQSRVRTALSSGGVKPVLDGSPGATHSVFATHFLDALTNNNTVLDTYSLFFELQKNVTATAAHLDTQQIPQYAPIRHSGHQAGEFVFVPQQMVRPPSGI